MRPPHTAPGEVHNADNKRQPLHVPLSLEVTVPILLGGAGVHLQETPSKTSA